MRQCFVYVKIISYTLQDKTGKLANLFVVTINQCRLFICGKWQGSYEETFRHKTFFFSMNTVQQLLSTRNQQKPKPQCFPPVTWVNKWRPYAIVQYKCSHVQIRSIRNILRWMLALQMESTVCAPPELRSLKMYQRSLMRISNNSVWLSSSIIRDRV